MAETFCGLPIEEAMKIIMIYKEYPNMQDYVQGFEDGVKYMKEFQERCFKEQMERMLGGTYE